MTLLLLALLAGLWAVVFMPTMLRARRTHSPIATVGMFNRSLRALGTPGAGGRWIMVPPDPIDEAAGSSKGKMMERRKRLFESLVAACAVTLIAGLIPSLRVMLWLNLVSDLMLVGFIYFLLSDKKSRSVRTDEPVAQESDDYFDELYLRAGQF